MFREHFAYLQWTEANWFACCLFHYNSFGIRTNHLLIMLYTVYSFPDDRKKELRKCDSHLLAKKQSYASTF